MTRVDATEAIDLVLILFSNFFFLPDFLFLLT